MHLLFDLLPELRTTKAFQNLKTSQPKYGCQQLITTPFALHSIAKQIKLIS